MGNNGRVFVRGLTSQTYGLREFRRRQLSVDRVRDDSVVVDDAKVGHSGDSVDLDYLMQLADAGSILGMDRFGLDLLLPFEERVNTVAELCKRGYADRMALAHDASCFIDWFDQEAKKQAVPKWNYRHISEDVLPALRERGVSDADITTMLVDVPRRYFE